MSEATGAALERLEGIMARLRAEGGCPWDREQDLRSLRPYLLEEAFEVLDEMDRVSEGGPWAALCEELGDLLFQIVFHAQLARELGEFQLRDVCNAISDKIERRHPHVFGEQKVKDAEQVLNNWARIKADERLKKTGRAGSVLDGVPTAAPSLLRAERLTEKASRIGFDWPDLKGVRGKLEEELRELDEAIAGGNRDELEHELGDVLFSLANLARFIKTPPEDALRAANRRFTSRFHAVEEGLRAQGVAFGGATLAQMDAIWDQAKAQEKALPPPRALPRAQVLRLRFEVGALAPVKKFWSTLAPALGWSERRAEHEGLAVYGDDALEICFVGMRASVPPPPARLTLDLDAPSPRAVETLVRVLAELASMRGGEQDDLAQKEGVAFTDPAGIRWRYGTREFFRSGA